MSMVAFGEVKHISKAGQAGTKRAMGGAAAALWANSTSVAYGASVPGIPLQKLRQPLMHFTGRLHVCGHQRFYVETVGMGHAGDAGQGRDDRSIGGARVARNLLSQNLRTR